MMRSTGFGRAMVAGVAVAALVAVAATGPVAAVSRSADVPAAVSGSTTSADVAASSVSGLSAAAPGFSDVDASNAFAADIAWFADAGITTGYADGTFRPLGSVTRGAMAAFLYRLVQGPTEPAACATGPFADVAATYPFCAHVDWLAGTHITTGWPDGTYRPAAAVSRGAMAAFLYRLANDGATAPACTTAPFTDVLVGAQFCGEIAWFAEQGITTGWPDGTFRPGASISRQAMAAFLHRFVDKGLVPGDPEPDQPGPQVSIDEPLGGSMVAGTVTVAVSWETSADLARVDLLVDGTAVASADADPFEITWDTTAVTQDAHALTVVATDVDGRTGTSDPVAVVVHQGPDPLQLLEDDLAAGTVTAEDYARYAVYRWFEPDLVPEQYQLPQGMGTSDLTVPLSTALRDFDSLDPAVQAELQAYLSPDDERALPLVPLTGEEVDAALAPYLEAMSAPLPVGDQAATGADTDAGTGLLATGDAWALGELSCLAPGVSVHWKTPFFDVSAGVRVEVTCKYSTNLADFYYSPLWGVDTTVDQLDGALRVASAGGGPNGVPDAIDEVAAAYYDSFRVYGNLGFDRIPKTKVVIGNTDHSGFSAPVLGVMFIDGYVPAAGNHGGRVYLMEHELFHQFQYHYLSGLLLGGLAGDYDGESQLTIGWWLEATAEWAAHQAQKAVSDNGFEGMSTNAAFATAIGGYASRLPDHLRNPSWALGTFLSPLLKGVLPEELKDVLPQYGSFLFAEYLDQRFGEDFILKTWQRIGDTEALPIDAIDAEVTARGAALADVVSAYHLANVDLTSSYGGEDPDLAEVLASSSGPAQTVVTAKDHEFRAGTRKVGPGGAFYLDLVLPEDSPGALVQVRLGQSGIPASAVTIEALTFTPEGELCTTFGPNDFWEDGYDSEITLLPDCPEVLLIVSDNRPESLVSTVFDGQLPSFTLTYAVTANEAAVAGLLGNQVDFIGTERMADAEGLGTIGHLLGEDGYVYNWGMDWTMAGYHTAITPVRDTGEVRLGGVRQVQAQCHGADYGWALGDDGRLSYLSDKYHQPMSEFSNVDHFALAWCGLVGYLVQRDGSLTFVNDLNPPYDTGPVTGEADVADVTVWAHGTAGYAITDDRELLYLDRATAVPVPGIDNVAAVTANSSGTAYVRHRDGTVSVFGIDAPLVARPVAGIPSVREIVAPVLVDQAYVLTDTDQLFVVQCDDTECSHVTVTDSGLSDVDTVSAAKDATAEFPIWVLLRSGELVELYMDGSGAHTTTTGLKDVVEVGTSGSASNRYAVHADGTVTTQAWLEGGWTPRQEVANVTTADDVLCSYGRCFINFK